MQLFFKSSIYFIILLGALILPCFGMDTEEEEQEQEQDKPPLALFPRASSLKLNKISPEDLSFTSFVKFIPFLTELDMRWLGLNDQQAGLFLGSLKNNKKIKKLNLSHNNLTDKSAISIADLIKEASFLYYVNLSWNENIGTEGGEALIKSLTNNTSLLELYLRGNSRIGESKKYDDSFAYEFNEALSLNTTLQILDLAGEGALKKSNGYFLKIGPGLKENKGLKIVYINGGPTRFFSSEYLHGAEEFIRCLNQNSTLEQVHMDCEGLILSPSSFITEELKKMFQFHSSLSDFNISVVPIINTSSVMEFINKALPYIQKNKNSIFIKYEEKTFSGKSIEELGKALGLFPDKEGLGISKMSLSDQGGASLLKSNFSFYNLKDLELCGNDLGDCSVQELSYLLGNPAFSLVNLDLADNKIGPEGFKAIGRSLKINKNLMALKVGGNPGLDEGLGSIIKGLLENSTLSKLDISNCGATARIAQCIEKLFHQQMPLRYLNLSFNQLGSEAGTQIARALEENTSLISLNMNNTDIGNQSAPAFANALAKNKRLRFLYLDSNAMFSDGVLQIINELLQNTSLQSLSLLKNNLNNNHWDKIFSILKENISLTTLNLSASRTNEEQQILNFLLQKNRISSKKKNAEINYTTQEEEDWFLFRKISDAAIDAQHSSKQNFLISSRGFDNETKQCAPRRIPQLEEISELEDKKYWDTSGGNFSNLIITPKAAATLSRLSKIGDYKEAFNYYEGGVILDLGKGEMSLEEEKNLKDLLSVFKKLTFFKIICGGRQHPFVESLQGCIIPLIKNRQQEVGFDLTECFINGIEEIISKAGGKIITKQDSY